MTQRDEVTFRGAKTEIWSRWKAGQSLHEIGRALGKDHGSIHFLLAQHGGIVPAPSPVRSEHLRRPNGKTSPEGSLPDGRFERSPGFATGSVDGEPGGGTPWRPALSSQRSRSAGLGVGLAAQDRACWLRFDQKPKSRLALPDLPLLVFPPWQVPMVACCEAQLWFHLACARLLRSRSERSNC